MSDRPYAFIYCMSVENSACPLADQLAACRARYAELDGYEWGDEWVDAAGDIMKKWRERQRGYELSKRLRAGDVLIVAAGGVIFGTAKEAAREMSELTQHGVEVQILDVPAAGAGALAWLQWAARIQSTRSKMSGAEVMNRRVRRGSPLSPRAARGWKSSHVAGRLVHIPDHHYRRWAMEFVRLHDEKGMSRTRIYWWARKRGARMSNGKEWGENGIQRAIDAARNGFPNRWADLQKQEAA